jgi:hypothetical protein
LGGGFEIGVLDLSFSRWTAILNPIGLGLLGVLRRLLAGLSTGEGLTALTPEIQCLFAGVFSGLGGGGFALEVFGIFAEAALKRLLAGVLTWTCKLGAGKIYY